LDECDKTRKDMIMNDSIRYSWDLGNTL